MTDQEALAAALDRSFGLDQLHPNDAFGAGFNAAIAWLRSQGEPVAYTCQNHIDTIEKKRSGFAGQADYLYAFMEPNDKYNVPLFLAPQPAIPDGWQLVPKKPTVEMIEAWENVTGQQAYRHWYIQREKNYRRMLASAPEYNQQQGEKK